MLKPIAFANALAVIFSLFAITLIALERISPYLFSLIFDAQFLGAPVSRIYLKDNANFGEMIIFSAVLGATNWVLGYCIAKLYNYFAK